MPFYVIIVGYFGIQQRCIRFIRIPSESIYLHLTFRPRIVYSRLSSFENNITTLSRHLNSILEKFRSIF
ncbi:hypothetical protein CISIN_1g035292mg [Citrus sinensis]|uniref:Uncharacterized protein n=1 Tax=Citrus sinensis TaxID=2711 RepID=A0A067EJ02_CITSI|nr:hypothetical protein CISIN_1g035292mg [Citrus sinensis]